MSIRIAVIVGVFWLISLISVATAREQAVQVVPLDPKILSGGDIGFRIDSMHGNVPIGTFVIRLNGKWVEPRSTTKAMRVLPLTQ